MEDDRPRKAQARNHTTDSGGFPRIAHRGESRRQLEFPDMFSLCLPDEGPTPCRPMILILDNGKTNQLGNLEYIGVMRHRDPLLCTMGQVAFYLFHRGEVRELPPQFWTRQQWYDTHFLKGMDRTAVLRGPAEVVQRRLHRRQLPAQKTHLGPSQGTKLAELEGVEENRIRRAGQWNRDPHQLLSGPASPEVPADDGGISAGRDGGLLAQVQPPESLVRALWPWIDQGWPVPPSPQEPRENADETTWRRRASSASSPSSARSSSRIRSSGVSRAPLGPRDLPEAGLHGVCCPAAAIPGGQHDARGGPAAVGPSSGHGSPDRLPSGPPPGRRFAGPSDPGQTPGHRDPTRDDPDRTRHGPDQTPEGPREARRPGRNGRRRPSCSCPNTADR